MIRKMSTSKSLLRNNQRLGDRNTPERSQDLLIKLKEYRVNSASKCASPLKYHSKTKSIISKPVPYQQNSSYRFINPSKTNRKIPSKCPDNLLEVVKMIEKPIQTWDKLSPQLYYQEKSDDRLYRGGKITKAKTKENPSEIKNESNADDHLFTKQQNFEFQEFLYSIHELYPLRFDLELNYQVIQEEVKESQHTMLSDYFLLHEKIENFLTFEAESIKTISSSEFVKILQDYNRIIRHILLRFKLKKEDNEAMLIEMLWRIIVKIFDNALIIHEKNILDLVEMSKIKTKNTIFEFTEKLKISEELFIKTKDDYEKIIKNYQEKISDLQASLAIKEKYITEHDAQIADLVEIINYKNSETGISKNAKDLDGCIDEIDDHQYKQSIRLPKLFIPDIINEKQGILLKETQTDLSLPNNPFPEYKLPKLSDNYFYKLYKPCSNLNTESVLQNCCKALDECSGEQQFYKQYGDYLIRKYKKNEIEEQLLATAWKLLEPNCIKSRLFSILLRFQEPISIEFELSLLKINQSLVKVTGKNKEGMLPLYKVIEGFQLFMPNSKEKIEKILSQLTYYIYSKIDINKNIWILLSRLNFALEKSKKSLKFHLELIDSKKEYIRKRYLVQSFQIVEWMKNKLGLWMKNSEIMTIIAYFGGENMKIQDILERFNAANLEKSKEIYILKEEILVLLINEWEEYQNQQILLLESIPLIDNYQE